MTVVLPLAIWRGIYDSARRWTPWAQCAVIAAAAVCTVSRSMILSLVIVCAVMIPFLPSAARRWAAVTVPAAVVAVFVLVPGMIATLVGTFSARATDPSITTRLNNHPRVEAMVADRPWAGVGPGTYMPVDALKILDNQYLKSTVEMGLPGAVAVVLFFGLPALAALMSARHLVDPSAKALAGAVAASAFAAMASSAMFDSLSFPTFTLVFAFVAGLSGTAWLTARRPTTHNPHSVSVADRPISPINLHKGMIR
jgi:O-antigen ligase